MLYPCDGPVDLEVIYFVVKRTFDKSFLNRFRKEILNVNKRRQYRILVVSITSMLLIIFSLLVFDFGKITSVYL